MADTPSQNDPTQEKKETPKQEAPAVAARTPLQVDDTRAVTSYANFCRVTGTPEELIIDVGLNAQPTGSQTSPIVINQRLVMNYYTAKRLLGALQLSIQRHEATFGVLEIDVQKRAQAGRPSSR